jgi:plastocyanin
LWTLLTRPLSTDKKGMQRLAICAVLLGLTATPVFSAEVSGTAQASGKPVQNAVIWLDAQAAPPLVQSASIVIDQRNLAFAPHVLAVRVGTSVDFPNNDRVFHNVFSFKDGKKFDLGMYPSGVKAKPVVFDKPGLSRIFCNIHPNMAAYVMAVDTPYYALSDERGAFTLSGVPPGTYTYHAWRPGGDTLTGTLTVGANKTLEVLW